MGLGFRVSGLGVMHWAHVADKFGASLTRFPCRSMERPVAKTHMSYSLNSLKGGYIGGLYRELL